MSDYSVGYRKPPRHAQFKPGNRANPYGRHGKKGRRTEVEIAHELMNCRVKYKEGGRVKRGSQIEVLIKSLGAAALRGDLAAAATLLKLRAFFERHPNRQQFKFVLSPADAVVL